MKTFHSVKASFFKGPHWPRHAGFLLSTLLWLGLVIYGGCLGPGSVVAPPVVQAQGVSFDVPELDIEINDAPDPVLLKGRLTYTITAVNEGAAPATDLVITSRLDDRVEFAAADAGGVHHDGVVTWTLQTLPLNSPVTFTVQVTAAQGANALLANIAQIRSAEGAIDLEAENTLVVAPEFELRKTAAPSFAQPGDTMTYTIVVRNIGSGPAANVTITDDLPSELAFVSASDNGRHDGAIPNGAVTWSVPSLAPLAAVTRTLTAKIDNSLGCGAEVTNVAKVAALNVTASVTVTTIPGAEKITVKACEDQNADGGCGPGGLLPSDAQACLVDENGQKTCRPTPAEFPSRAGVFTASLEFTGSSQGYYATLPPQRIETSGCEEQTVELPAVYPVHPKGIGVHQPSNKVYVAFQGPKVGTDDRMDSWPYPFVAVIDGDTDQVLHTIPGGPEKIGRQPWSVTVSGDKVYVGSFGDGRIAVIDALSDTVMTNLEPGRSDFQPVASAVNPANGRVFWPDYRGGRIVVVDGLDIVEQPKIDIPPQASYPFELVVFDDGDQGHSFVTMRDAIPPHPYKLASYSHTDATLHFIDLVLPDGTTGSPHALALWVPPDATEGHLFVTLSDDPRQSIPPPFPNPYKLVTYKFPVDDPHHLTLLGVENVPGDYAEAGLVYNAAVGRLLGTFSGSIYDIGDSRTDVEACSGSDRGGVYGVDFSGVPSFELAPSLVVGNPPLIPAQPILDWQNPFEIEVNPVNGKIYVTDRCWNDYSVGGREGGAAVLVYEPTIVLSNSGTRTYLPLLLKP